MGFETIVTGIIVPILTSVVFVYWLWRKSERKAFEELCDEADIYWRRFVMTQQVEHADEVEIRYRRALRRDGKRQERVEVYRKLAEVYEQTGRLKDALSSWEQCARLNANDAEARANIERLRAALMPPPETVLTEDVSA